MEILNHDHEDKEDGKEVTHDVCKAIEDMKEESRQEGRQEGRLEGRLEGRQEESNQKICIYVTMLMKNLNLTEEKACQVLEITPEDYRAARAAVMAHEV